MAAGRVALAAEGGAAVSDINLAAALLVVAVLAILLACLAMSAWNWAAVRVLDVVFGAIETAIRQIANRR